MRETLRKLMLTITMFFLCGVVVAEVAVSDVQVFSGHPWKEVVVGYTITGADDRADIIQLTATDHSAKKTYTAQTLSGAQLTEGRHVLRWDAAVEGVKFSSTNVVFSVSVIGFGGVRLWEDGPCWAECNVGATNPEEYGYYFWWGDTVGYKRNAKNNGWISVRGGSAFSFSWENCPTVEMDGAKLWYMGYIGNAGNLVAAHDAATAYLGAPWRMPTVAEINALISKCDTTWTTRNGVYGRLITGKGAYAAKSIFLPAAGYGRFDYLKDSGSYGYYWSSTPYSDMSNYAWYLIFYSDHFGRYYYDTFRYYGFPVRPVRGFSK